MAVLKPTILGTSGTTLTDRPGVSKVADADVVEAKMVDLRVAGSNGAMRLNHHWVSNAAYVQQKVIAVLVAVPKAMDYLEEAEKQKQILKSLIETWPQTIDGLNSSVTWEYGEVASGHSGEMFEAAVDSKRERSVPAITWSERHGLAITKFLTNLFSKVVLDPDLGVPGVVNEPLYLNAGSPQLLPEDQTLTVLFIEPDKNLRNVVKAWLCTNMMPKSAGENLGKREVGAAGEILEVSVEWTAYTDQSAAVYLMASRYLKSLALADMRPQDATVTFQDVKDGVNYIDPDIQESKSANGYSSALTTPVTPV